MDASNKNHPRKIRGTSSLDSSLKLSTITEDIQAWSLKGDSRETTTSGHFGTCVDQEDLAVGVTP